MGCPRRVAEHSVEEGGTEATKRPLTRRPKAVYLMRPSNVAASSSALSLFGGSKLAPSSTTPRPFYGLDRPVLFRRLDIGSVFNYAPSCPWARHRHRLQLRPVLLHGPDTGPSSTKHSSAICRLRFWAACLCRGRGPRFLPLLHFLGCASVLLLHDAPAASCLVEHVCLLPPQYAAPALCVSVCGDQYSTQEMQRRMSTLPRPAYIGTAAYFKANTGRMVERNDENPSVTYTTPCPSL